MSLDSLTTRFSSLQAEVEQSSDRIQQLTRLLKLEQAYSAKVKEEITKRVLEVDAAVQQCQQQTIQQADEHRTQLQQRDEAERHQRAEHQQREAQLQAVIADMDERLAALQASSDDYTRQQQQHKHDLLTITHQTNDRLTTLTHYTDDTAKRVDSLAHQLSATTQQSDTAATHYHTEFTTLKQQQRSQLLQCVNDLRVFQLSVRDEMQRRERQVEVMKKAVLMMSEEMDRGGGGSGAAGGGVEKVRRWREEERREREERERRRRREELAAMRDDIYRYIDTRISSLPPTPAPVPPPPPPTRPSSVTYGGHERHQRAERLRGVDGERWVERSMEQLLSDLTADRERERGKANAGVPVERGGYRDGARARSSAATTTAHGGYRAAGNGGGGSTAAPLSARQRTVSLSNQRPTRAGIGR